MKLLIFNATHFCTGTKPIGLSLLKSYLQRHGHKVKIVDLSRYSIDKSTIQYEQEGIQVFKPVPNTEEHLVRQIPMSREQVFDAILHRIYYHHPDLIGVSMLTNNLALAESYFRDIKRMVDIPLVVGGIHATVAPEQTINLAWVDMICLGFGEEPLLRLLDSGLKDHGIPNMWFEEKDYKVTKNDIEYHAPNFSKSVLKQEGIIDQETLDHYVKNFVRYVKEGVV